jgi:signal transduction histidine kinase
VHALIRTPSGEVLRATRQLSAGDTGPLSTRLSTLKVYPEYPPRVRIEWLIAGSRVVLAGGALLAVAISPFGSGDDWRLALTIGGYFIYSLCVLALVWAPVRFAPAWGLSNHLADLSAFSLFTYFTEAPTSPFFIYFTFLVICGTLRWDVRGAVWTAAASFVVYAATSLYTSQVLYLRPFATNAFVVRSVHLAVTAALIAYLGAYHRRFQRDIGRIIGWPRRVPRQPRELVGEIIAGCSEVLEAPKVLIVWEDPDEGEVNLAWGSGGDVTWASEPEATYGSFVVSGLERKTFQAADVGDERGVVVHWTGGAFRQRVCRPINPALQARFSMRRVQSWSLDGELIRGRLFALDKRSMRLDDLILGDVVARLTVSRLESLYLLRRLRQAAALDERLRVARDIHDSLLQSTAGSALQLLAARRLLESRPDEARRRLEEVQNQLENGELEMRSFIQRLRPVSGQTEHLPPLGLAERLEELRRRVERQWEIKVKVTPPSEADMWHQAFLEGVYRIVQEGVLNAARHADPSLISVDFAVDAGVVRLQISDDGGGFPFHGTFDLQTLNAMHQGPLSLKERVAELQGRLLLRTSETGTQLAIELPLAPRPTEDVAPAAHSR